jgi:hypothetical protein
VHIPIPEANSSPSSLLFSQGAQTTSRSGTTSSAPMRMGFVLGKCDELEHACTMELLAFCKKMNRRKKSKSI